jgi:hypothetical protein
MGDLSEAQMAVLNLCYELFALLQGRKVEDPLELVLLKAIVMADAFPIPSPIDTLVATVAELLQRSAVLQRAVGDHVKPSKLQVLLENGAIATLCAREDSRKQPLFEFTGQTFGVSASTRQADGKALRDLAREIVDWRLAEFLAHKGIHHFDNFSDSSACLFLARRKKGTPLLQLAEGGQVPIPSDIVRVHIGTDVYLTQVVADAITSVWRPDDKRNALPALLRTWFGGDVGDERSTQRVALRQASNAWQLEPVHVEPLELHLWNRYSREQIPGLFGLTFSQAIWNTGYVSRQGHIFLLVTLQKGDLHESFQYQDRFLSPSLFQWQSQNRTSQNDAEGIAIKNHVAKGIPVHLFVRLTKKAAAGVAVPFLYCGDVLFQDWEGERPITVRWALSTPVPERMYASLQYKP